MWNQAKAKVHSVSLKWTWTKWTDTSCFTGQTEAVILTESDMTLDFFLLWSHLLCAVWSADLVETSRGSDVFLTAAFSLHYIFISSHSVFINSISLQRYFKCLQTMKKNVAMSISGPQDVHRAWWEATAFSPLSYKLWFNHSSLLLKLWLIVWDGHISPKLASLYSVSAIHPFYQGLHSCAYLIFTATLIRVLET